MMDEQFAQPQPKTNSTVQEIQGMVDVQLSVSPPHPFSHLVTSGEEIKVFQPAINSADYHIEYEAENKKIDWPVQQDLSSYQLSPSSRKSSAPAYVVRDDPSHLEMEAQHKNRSLLATCFPCLFGSHEHETPLLKG